MENAPGIGSPDGIGTTPPHQLIAFVAAFYYVYSVASIGVHSPNYHNEKGTSMARVTLKDRKVKTPIHVGPCIIKKRGNTLYVAWNPHSKDIPKYTPEEEALLIETFGNTRAPLLLFGEEVLERWLRNAAARKARDARKLRIQQPPADEGTAAPAVHSNPID